MWFSVQTAATIGEERWQLAHLAAASNVQQHIAPSLASLLCMDATHTQELAAGTVHMPLCMLHAQQGWGGRWVRC
jgi:hypothetical protein